MRAHRTSLFELLFFMLLALVFVVAFFLRTHALDAYPKGISNDEAVNVIDGFHIAQSGVAPAYEDRGRPEPLYRIVLAVGMSFFGDTVWAARFTGALLNLLTIAAVYWFTVELLHDTGKATRRTAGLLAVMALTVMLGHITFSRALYRAIPQLLFVALSAGFVLRGLRTYRWRDFALTGVFGALALYVYPAAFFYPPALIMLGIALFLFRLRTWKTWLPRMALAALVAVVIASPLLVLFLSNSQAVLGRVQAVSGEEQAGLSQRDMTLMVSQFLSTGDENPQYNVALAPVVPPFLQAFFVLGLLALLIRLRKPGSLFVLSMLLLFTIPALASNEITHGLRISSEYIVVPVIIGSGLALLLSLLPVKRWPRLNWLYGLAMLGILGGLAYGAATAWATYRDYWEHPEGWKQWQVFGLTLDHNEWFFRTDRREFAAWIAAQDTPLLIPQQELNQAQTRSWLLEAFPRVTTASGVFSLPDDTRLVVPWSIGHGDLLRDSRHYALLHEGEITLLPPLSEETHAALLAVLDDGQELLRDSEQIPRMGAVAAIPASLDLTFAPSYAPNGSAPLASFHDGAFAVLDWYGESDLSQVAGELEITLLWTAHQPLVHEYVAFLQLQTQDYERISGDDEFVQRWLYPGTMWAVGARVPDVRRLSVPPDLAPGAYRLMLGAYVTNYNPLPAQSSVGQVVGNMAHIGWLKMPQEATPTLPTSDFAPEVIIADAFQLRFVEAAAQDDGQLLVHLYWESLVQRPALDATIFVHAVDENGDIAGQHDSRPWGGQYPTFIWDAGEIVRTAHVLPLGESDAASLTLRLGMYTFPGPQNLAALVNGDEVTNGLVALGALDGYLQEER